MLTRQEAALDRSIDRKVRIILTMRQEHAAVGAVREPPRRVSRTTAREVAPNFSSAGAPTESGRKTRRSLKIAGKCENVIENKGPAAEGVAA